jgi:DNA-binding response OmpR family regulator
VPTVLLATDADWIRDEVAAALTDESTTVRVVREGKAVTQAVKQLRPDLVVLDLQIGNMGGFATCMNLRLDAGAGRLPEVPVIILLDRLADVFLAQRCDADGWLVKPLDSIRLQRAAKTVMDGGSYAEGLPAETREAIGAEGVDADLSADGPGDAEPAGPDAIPAGLGESQSS